MCFHPNKGSLCWALVGRSCVHPGPFGDESNGTTHIVGQDFFDERLAVGMVDSLSLRVGESQLLAWGGRAPGSGRVRQDTTTTFGVVCAIIRTRERTSVAVPICHRFWAVSGSGARPGSFSPVGQIAFQWCLCATVVAMAIVAQVEGHPDTPFLGAAAACARSLVGTIGFDPTVLANSVKGCDPGHSNQMRWNQTLLEEGGSTKQR